MFDEEYYEGDADGEYQKSAAIFSTGTVLRFMSLHHDISTYSRCFLALDTLSTDFSIF